MKLSIPFLKTNKDSSFHYLALILSNEKAEASILEEDAGQVKIISRHSQKLPDLIDKLSIEELVEAVEKALAHAEEVLPANVEIKKTVFGVGENWVENDSKNIKKQYLQILKKVCDKLDLSPIGFMVVSEAISNLIQKEEGAPLSAVLADLGEKMITLTLVRGGKIISTVSGERHGDPAASVNEVLKKFTVEVLPARIVLYDSLIKENLVQNFIGFSWSKSLPFLHIPQISVLSEDFDSKAVAFGAATQMGFDIPDETETAIKSFDAQAPIPAAAHAAVKTHTHKEEKDPDVAAESGEDFGFVQDKDVAEDLAQASPAFVKSEKTEIDKQTTTEVQEARIIDEVDEYEETKDEELYEEEEEGKKPFTRIFEKIKIPRLSIPIASPVWLRLVVIPLILLGLLIGGTYYLYFNKVSASLILAMTPKDVTKTVDIVFAADGNNDFSNNTITAKTVNGTMNGDMTIGATGKKEVGEKAKGNVTIYNNDTKGEITLQKGAVIKSENGLEFVLDKEVKVASASGDIFSGTKPGTAKVDVVASEIGANYNLPSDTKFSLNGNDQVAAKNDSAFSGGSSKNITVVSKADLEKLSTDLLKSLEEKAVEKLTSEKGAGQNIVPIVLSTTTESTKYDRKEGDEAKTVKLTAGIKFAGLSYEDADAAEYAKALMSEEHGDEMELKADSVNIEIENLKKKSDEEISATLTITAELLPKIETSKLVEEISGKSVKEANDILGKLPQVERTFIEYNPNIAFLASIFPRLPNHVSITLSSNK